MPVSSGIRYINLKKQKQPNTKDQVLKHFSELVKTLTSDILCKAKIFKGLFGWCRFQPFLLK